MNINIQLFCHLAIFTFFLLLFSNGVINMNLFGYFIANLTVSK